MKQKYLGAAAALTKDSSVSKKGFIIKLSFITQFENIQIQSFKGVIYAWLQTTYTLNMLMTVFEEDINIQSG